MSKWYTPTSSVRPARRRHKGVYARSSNAKATRALREISRLMKEEEIKETAGNVVPAAIAADTWGTAVYINDIDIGNTSSTRIGNKIVIKSLSIRGTIAPDALETTLTAVRICIVYDRRPDGALPTGAQIFDQNNIRGHINSANPLYAGKFLILVDRIFKFKDLQTGDRPRGDVWKTFIKKNLKCEYNTTGGGIADIQKGSIIGLACSYYASHDTNCHLAVKIKYADS